jgi:hypothetical protein
MRILKPLAGLLAMAAFCVVPSSAATSAVPGAVNYIEGQVTVDGRAVTSTSVGSLTLQPNQVIQTTQGRAEMLLTPGIFLRMGDNSSVRMVSPSLSDTRVQVLTGDVIVEADQVFKDSNISVMLGATTSRLAKHGLYDFNANTGQVSVLDGKLEVLSDDHHIDLGKGHEVAVAGPLKGQHFDTKALEQQNQLYAWSRLRSEYDSEAAMQSASTVVVGGPGWWGPGWYWNPYWGMYSFLPGDGFFYSPFGWPYYSPGFIYAHPGFRYGYAPRAFVGGGISARAYGGGLAGRGFVGGGFAGRGFGGGGFRR